MKEGASFGRALAVHRLGFHTLLVDPSGPRNTSFLSLDELSTACDNEIERDDPEYERRSRRTFPNSPSPFPLLLSLSSRPTSNLLHSSSR